jgi:phosphoglucosamine mutase
MAKLFGTDGIRGLANVYPMDPATVMTIASAAADELLLLSSHIPGRQIVVIGKDTRASSDMLESAAAAGFASRGVDVFLAGVVPTPAVSALVRGRNYLGGVVISASHNPWEDNGFKLFGPGGSKLDVEVEEAIEARISLQSSISKEQSLNIDNLHEEDLIAVGSISVSGDCAENYLKTMSSAVEGLSLNGMKIIVDCANGAASAFTPKVLEKLGAKVIAVNVAPDGTNINHCCGSQHLEVASALVLEHKACLGISHDGDADRVLFIDELGQEVDGDHILAFCAAHLWKGEGGIPNNKVVSTVMANLGLENALREEGVELLRTDVGDRWVKEAMDRESAVLGGEQSGHIIFSEYSPTGDGLLTALKVLEVVRTTGKTLSELASLVTKCPQILINVKVSSKPDFSTMTSLMDEVAIQEEILGTGGRILLRYSGTENLARVMVEGVDEKQIGSVANIVAQIIEKHIGLGGGL